MLRAWNLIGRSGGRFPTPFMQDPVILIIILLVPWLFFCSMFGTYAFSLFLLGPTLLFVGIFIAWVVQSYKQHKK